MLERIAEQQKVDVLRQSAQRALLDLVGALGGDAQHFICLSFFFNDTATTEIYTLSLHDALPILGAPDRCGGRPRGRRLRISPCPRSEEHTSELQSHSDLVCRLLLEKKQKNNLAVRMQEVPATPEQHNARRRDE